MVDKIRGTRQIDLNGTFGKRLERLLVANVLAGFDVTRRQAERQAPGKKRVTFADAMYRKAMAFENGVREFDNQLPNQNARTGGKRLQRDRDVVARGRNAGDIGKCKRLRQSDRHSIQCFLEVTRE